MFKYFVFIIILTQNGCNGLTNTTRCIDTNQIFALINSLIEKIENTVTLSAPKTKVYYYLYTRLNVNNAQEIIMGNLTSLETSNFNREWPIRFIISGWMNIHNGCAGIQIKNAYLERGNFNVIIVGWDEISRDINYFYLSLTIDSVAREFANFTRFLAASTNITYSNIYVIGFSLGAQIAGSAGKQIYPDKFKTIFALEPAGPMFYGLGFDKRIDASDAEYVEAIQTNIGIAGFYGEGGRASFYPNYGHNQPHCPIYNPGCNHAAAYEYFVESINAGNDGSFYGVKCESFNKLASFNKCNCKFYGNNCSIVRMGGEPSTPKEGVYFLRTNRRKPYSRPMKNLTEF